MPPSTHPLEGAELVGVDDGYALLALADIAAGRWEPLSQSHQPVTANPVRTLTLWGVAGSPRRRGCVGNEVPTRGEGFPPKPPSRELQGFRSGSRSVSEKIDAHGRCHGDNQLGLSE